MSGIGGMFHRDGQAVNEIDFRRLHRALEHRGPDGGSIWIDDCMGLSNQLLRTSPAAGTEHQPFVDALAGLAITFDGRLDNRDHLESVLPILQGAPHAAGDAALVLRAYQRWGSESPARLLGDFAFAIWDRRARRLFCARDVMGIRPFCYAVAGSSFLFGSEVQQLLASGSIDAEPDEHMVAQYLANQTTSRDATVYRRIRRLPPAHSMTIDADRISIDRFWRLDASPKLRYQTDREYAEHFLSIFNDAVACRLVSARPHVGAYLSGGVDSSSVVAMAKAIAAEHHAPVLDTFSLIFPEDAEADERAYIADVARRCAVPSHLMRADPPSAARFREQAECYRDVPDPPGGHMMADLRRTIRDRGIRVVLTGEGGDHGFSGSLYHYADLLRQFRLREAWNQFRADARVSDVGWSPSRIVTTGVVPLLPRTFKNALRPLARRRGWPGGLPRWIPAAFASRVGLMDGPRIPPAPHASFGDMRVCDALENGWSTLALEMAERTAARFGLEERHPLFDRRIIEFAVAIPETQRWRDTRTKLVLRNAMRSLLPPSVYGRRDKADFSAHVVAALQALGGEEFLSQLQMASQGWIDLQHVRLMYREMMLRFSRAEASYTDYMFPLWMIASTELWFRTLDPASERGGRITRGVRLAPTGVKGS